MKKQFRCLAAALTVMAGATIAHAQDEPAPERLAAPSGITVQGRGEVQVKPDIARLSLGVQTDGKDGAEAARENAERTSRVIAAVRGAGVAERDIQTVNYSIQPQYDYRPRPEGGNQAPVILGYQVNNTVRVTVRRLGDASKVIDAAVRAGANVAAGIAFDVENPDASRAAALREAVADALRKGRVIAEAIRARGVTLVAVVEGPVATPRPMLEMMSLRTAAGAEAAQTPVQPGEQTVTAFVTARFRFTPGDMP